MAVIVYKPIGKTPLEVLQEYKLTNQISGTCAFSGRLDPMAHGQLMILYGDQLKRSEYYNKKDKKYKFRMLIGISTDTTDILGLIDNTTDPKLIDETIIRDLILEVTNDYDNKEYYQEYHKFSSMRVDIDNIKTPLWKIFSDKSIDSTNIIIPKKKVSIYSLTNLSIAKMDSLELKTLIDTNLSLITDKSKFRLDEIRTSWDNYFDNNKDKQYYVLEYDTHVSSGTYIRQLVKDIGKKMGIPTMVIEIYRYELSI